jgi:hypothetical protein
MAALKPSETGPLEDVRPVRSKIPGFVGAESCQECHPHNHATWHASYHRTMTQVATPKTALGDFANYSTTSPDGRHRIQLDSQDGQLWFTLTRTSTGEAPGHQNRLPLTLMTGSHHLQTYWASKGPGRSMIDMPLAWLTKDRRWVPRMALFLVPHDDTLLLNHGGWNEFCIHCHTTQGRTQRPEAGGRTHYDTMVSEFGISCEACHGPAENHVAAHQVAAANGTAPGAIAGDVVNPAALSASKSSAVCGSCHSAHIERYLDSRHNFRPGDDLDGTRNLFSQHKTLQDLKAAGAPPGLVDEIRDKLENTFWSDGVARVLGRDYTSMIESACHKNGEMSCLSCHTMHPDKSDPRPLKEWANDQLGPDMDGDQACTQCHAAADYAAPKHTHHAADSVGASCLNCHMPNTAFGLMTLARNHTIEIPSVQRTLDTGRPNACNLCHLDRSLGWTSNHLTEWFKTPAPTLDDQNRNISAAVLWALKGDANQRAIIAWHMGWKPALKASGADWMTPYLAEFMDDSYDAVRYIAWHSLNRDGYHDEKKYDFVAPAKDRRAITSGIRTTWTAANRKPAAHLLIGESGIETNRFNRLLEKRDHRPVKLVE